MERRYGALGFFAALYQIIGVLAVAAGILAIINSLASYRASLYSPTMITVLSFPIGVIIAGIGFYAFGELIHLLRDMEFNSRVTAHYTELNEKNTRRTAEAMEHLARRRTQNPSGGTLPPQS